MAADEPDAPGERVRTRPGDARVDQGVEDEPLRLAEPGHHRGGEVGEQLPVGLLPLADHDAPGHLALVAVLGSVLGAALAWLAGAATNSYYRRYFDTELIFSLITPRIVLFSVCLSLLLGLAAGTVAAWRLVRTPPMVLWGRG